MNIYATGINNHKVHIIPGFTGLESFRFCPGITCDGAPMTGFRAVGCDGFMSDSLFGRDFEA